MTTITIGKDYIEVQGHSGYDAIGKDIVCAAISTLVEATYNYLRATGNNVETVEHDGYYQIRLKKPYVYNSIGVVIVNEFESMCFDLMKQYPNNIKLERVRGQ